MGGSVGSAPAFHEKLFGFESRHLSKIINGATCTVATERPALSSPPKKKKIREKMENEKTMGFKNYWRKKAKEKSKKVIGNTESSVACVNQL
jgi:hypothetical protein